MLNSKPIVILGAGLAGLSAAYRLKSGYRILERLKKSGGLCVTDEERGFKFDKTGHLLHLRDSRIKKIVFSLLDEEPTEIERKSTIFLNGTYTKYPFQANTYGLPKQVIAECLKGFFQASLCNARDETQITNFEDFIYRHFGHGIAKHFMIPYNTKLWGVHPRRINAKWCDRFVPIPNAAEVIDGALGLSQQEMGYNAKFFYPKNGIQDLPEAFARKVQNIELATSPQAIDLKNKRILLGGKWCSYRALISTIPLPDLIGIITDAPLKIRKGASVLRCSALRYLDVALKTRTKTNDNWTYVPENKYPFYRVGCYSSFSPRMAPKGRSNLYVELAARRSIDMGQIMPKVSRGLVDMGIISNTDQIDFAIPRHIKRAYVIYDDNREIELPKLLAKLEENGVFSAGRYSKWEYSAMEDAIIQGFDAADKAKKLE